VKNFQKEFRVSFPVLSDVEGKTGWDYLIRGHPVTYLVDRRGVLAGKVIGERDWSSLEAKDLTESLLSR